MSCFADLLYSLFHGQEGLSLSLKINRPWQVFFFQEIFMMELLLVVFLSPCTCFSCFVISSFFYL